MNSITLGNQTYTLPYADLLPDLPPKDYADLRSDIEQRGVIVPVVIDEHHAVIDGQHRLKVAADLNLDSVPLEIRAGLSEDEKRALAWDLNAHRRHMTEEQRKARVADLRTQGLSTTLIAEQLGVDGSTVARDLSGFASAKASQELIIGKDGKKYPAKQKEGTRKRGRKPAAPKPIRTYTDTHEAVRKELEKLPADHRSIALGLCRDGIEDARDLTRLHKSMGSPETNGTYLEIVTTGGFHYGDDMEYWLDFANSTRAEKKKAYDSLAKHHARIAKEQQAADAGELDGLQAKRIIECTIGDWWQLGDHHLFCGDTSTQAFIQHLPQSSFAFADPPYNANVAEWDSGFVWSHDYLIDFAPIVAVTPGIGSIASFFGEGTTMPYAWSMAAWITNGMTRGALGFGNWIYIALFTTLDSIHRNAQDVIRINIQASENENHFKGRKPSMLMMELLTMFTKKGDTVIDPFLGSGTTLMAAEHTGRICIGGEIDIERCALIIAKWEALTGEQAKRI